MPSPCLRWTSASHGRILYLDGKRALESDSCRVMSLNFVDMHLPAYVAEFFRSCKGCGAVRMDGGAELESIEGLSSNTLLRHAWKRVDLYKAL